MLSQEMKEAVGRYGTPCYLYDEAVIATNAARFLSIPYAATAVHFASMANDNPVLLQLLRQLGLGIFVNSEKHLGAAMAAGFRGSEIVYAAAGLKPAQIRRVRMAGVRLHLDSLSQIETFGTLFPGEAVGVRINMAERSRGGHLAPATSRIGITAGELPALFDAANAAGLRLIGTHAYLGTNIRSAEEMLDGVEAALALSKRFPDLEYVDLGGGFPAADDASARFDFDAYAAALTARMNEYSRERGREIGLIIEPGRALLADAAVFCTSITDVKERDDRVIACCDGSVSMFPRPLINGEYHPAFLAGGDGHAPLTKPVDVVGSTTFSGDYLVRDASFPRPRIGDLVVIERAGSYCYSMMTRFLGQGAPAEVLIGCDGDARGIRARETVPCAD